MYTSSLLRLFCLILVVYDQIIAYISNNVPLDEVLALQSLFDSTDGTDWIWRPVNTSGKVWNFTTQIVDPCDNWQGISCGNIADDSFLHIFNLTLPSYNLNGTLPNQLADLYYLDYLDLDKNSINGTLPAALCNLTKLTEMTMRSNYLTGHIPSCLQSNLTSLSTLSLHSNFLSSSIPEFGNLSSLRYLSYSNNHLTGTLPSSLQYLNISKFFVIYNQLHGDIDVLGNFTFAVELSLSYNAFSGTLPESFCTLTQMTSLHVENNIMRGSIPKDIGNMSLINRFILFSNEFTGSLPESIGQMKDIDIFCTDENFLTGTLPSSMKNWKYIEQITIFTNYHSGSTSNLFASSSQLLLLLIQNNFFTGNLYTTFNGSSQSNMQDLDISANKFTGSLPEQIFGPSLTTFIAFDCCFSGRIPSSICNAKQLTTLVLDGLTNACSKNIWPGIPGSPKYARSVPGSIPDCVWRDLDNLTTLHVSGNGLTGTIPDLDTYANITDLELSFNSLSGSIPLGLQKWTPLQTLNLESNRFVGTIDKMGGLDYFYDDDKQGLDLNLGTNRLSGVIPKAMEYAYDMKIVEGNLFSCSFAHEPPYSDPNSNNFICGSTMADISLKMFAIVGGLVFIGVCFGIYSLYISYDRSQGKEGGGMWSTLVSITDMVQKHNYAELQLLLDKVDLYSPSYFERCKVLSLQILIWRSKLLHTIEFGNAEPKVANLVQFIKSLRCLSRLSIILMFISVICGLPMFAILKLRFRTYTRQYRWEASGVFLSGYAPAIAVLFFWVLLLYISLHIIVRDIPKYTFDRAGNVRESLMNSVKTSVKSILNKAKKTSSWVAFSILCLNILVVVAVKGVFIYLLVTTSTTFSVKMVITAVIGGIDVVWGAVLVPYMINRLPNVSSSGKMMMKLSTVFTNSIFASTLAIMIADTSCFQGIFVPQSKTTEDFSFNYCAYYKIGTSDCAGELYSFTAASTYVPVFNYNYNCYSTVVTQYVPIFFLSFCFLSLAIPLGSILATRSGSVTSLTYFYPAIFWISTTSTAIQLDSSTPFKGDKNAKKQSKDSDEIAIHERSNEEKKTEVEAAQVSVDDTISDLHSTSVDSTPTQNSYIAATLTSTRLLFPAFILAAGMHHILVMLTFGLFYPVLNVLVCLLVCVTAFTWETLIGRWLLTAGKESASLVNPYTLKLDEVCKNVCCAPRNSLGLISIGSGVIVGLAVMDMAGDEVGWRRSVWGLVTAVLVSFVLYFYFKRQHIFDSREEARLTGMTVVEQDKGSFLNRVRMASDGVWWRMDSKTSSVDSRRVESRVEMSASVSTVSALQKKLMSTIQEDSMKEV